MMKLLKIVMAVMVVEASIALSAYAQVTKSNLDQNAEQAQGNYAATNLNYLGSGSLGMMQSAWKDPLQHMGEGQSKPGYSKYYWTPELVLPVRLREGMYTLINFPNWEIIENVYLGDGQSFNAEIQGPSSLMVYPEASQFVGVDTNMIVFGRSGNKYVFYVQSETINTDRITNSIIDIEVVKGKNSGNGSGLINGGNSHVNANSYGQDGTSTDASFTRDLQKEDWIEKIPVDPTQFKFDIEVYVPNPDDIIIAPERVWHDNIFTYIDLGEKALTALQRPVVTLIIERSESPVGFRAAGPHNRLIVVEAIGDMVLRSGKRIVCLKMRRADSDGLENTIYAKSNEWNLQNAHASKPNEENLTDMPSMENVYGSSADSQNNQAGGFDFFNDSLFTTDGISGSLNNGSLNKGNNTQQGGMSNIDTLPKVSPVIAGTPTEPKVTGQYDVNIGKAEVIEPNYNNQKVNMDVSYQPEKKTTVKDNPLKLGNSKNNSSPILIRPKEELSGQKTLISAETEAFIKEFRDNNVVNTSENSNISIELGTDENVNNLEKLWSDISKKYSAEVGKYQPFYSVDAPADGQGKDVFHLRVGPVNSLSEGDKVCSQLGRNGIFCSVVRIQ